MSVPRLLDYLTAIRREASRGLLQIFYPACCHLCVTPLQPDVDYFCPSCRAGLFTDSLPSCPHCAGTIGPFAKTEDGCPHCRRESFAFDAAVRCGPYEGVLRDAILKLKYHTGEGLAELLGMLWAERDASRLRALEVNAVVPVPLHWRRRWQRGYNQSAALARSLAHHLQIPYFPHWLRRLRNTPRQTEQTIAGRRDNVRNAFHARPGSHIKGCKVLLVDDVVTTGATVNEAARALRTSGAERVTVAMLARAGAVN